MEKKGKTSQYILFLIKEAKGNHSEVLKALKAKQEKYQKETKHSTWLLKIISNIMEEIDRDLKSILSKR